MDFTLSLLKSFPSGTEESDEEGSGSGSGSGSESDEEEEGRRERRRWRRFEHWDTGIQNWNNLARLSGKGLGEGQEEEGDDSENDGMGGEHRVCQAALEPVSPDAGLQQVLRIAFDLADSRHQVMSSKRHYSSHILLLLYTHYSSSIPCIPCMHTLTGLRTFIKKS